MVVHVCGTDEGELVLKGYCKNNTVVVVLEDIGSLMIKELFNKYMAPFHHANMFRSPGMGNMGKESVKPGTSCVDEHPGFDRTFFGAVFVENF